jgi:general secretion pathway protein G
MRSHSTTHRRKFAFTIIELLVVVSVIAILASIALVNLLQAQTRSKVSRALADMKAIEQALESYYVDHNTYPEDYAASKPQEYGMGRLTSPIAYISSVPLDVFGGYLDTDRDEHVKSYSLGTSPEDRPIRWALVSVGPDSSDDTSPIFDYPGYSPDLFDNPTGPYRYIRYDPTNGTVSVGDIIRVSDFGSDKL